MTASGAVPEEPTGERAVLITHADGTAALIPVSALRAFSLTDDSAGRAAGQADAAGVGWTVQGTLPVRWLRPWAARPDLNRPPPHPMACVGQGVLISPEGLAFIDLLDYGGGDIDRGAGDDAG